MNYNQKTGVFIRKYNKDFSPQNNGKYSGKICGYENCGYWKIKIDGSSYLAHRLAWIYIHGDVLDTSTQIDHKNLDTLDNSIGNLRVATHRQNNANASRHKNKKLPKGVTKQSGFKKYGGYLCRITFNYKTICLGTFHTIAEASAAYRQAATRYNGEFARVS